MQEERLRENTTKDKQNFTRVLLRLSLRREGSGDTSLQPSSTKGGLLKSYFLYGQIVIEQEGMVLSKNRGYLDYMLGENTVRVVRDRNVLPREVVEYYLE